jgi:hypothetical protein
MLRVLFIKKIASCVVPSSRSQLRSDRRVSTRRTAAETNAESDTVTASVVGPGETTQNSYLVSIEEVMACYMLSHQVCCFETALKLL